MEKNLLKTVLLIENQLEEANLIRGLLVDPSCCAFELTHVEALADAEKYLAAHSVDIVLLDSGMADPSGLDAIRRVRGAAPRVSVVLLSSAGDERSVPPTAPRYVAPRLLFIA
jgi:DNA-binding response OmpR family regulator